jgi:hypothetical protein
MSELEQSLAAYAERVGDPVPVVYERFFDLCEPARELMGHSDEHMRGRMFEQVLELLFTDAHFGPGGYLDWELDNHLLAYQATGEMYVAFFTAVMDVVRDGLGPQWSTAYHNAWQDRIDLILAQVREHPAVAET